MRVRRYRLFSVPKWQSTTNLRSCRILDNQLAAFTLSEVEDLMPVLAPVLNPIYGAIGVHRYPTNPLRLASQSLSISMLTFLKNKKPHNYQQMVERGLFLLVYTTTKSEIQQDEYLMGIVRTRTKEACALPREYGPVNWYGSTLDTSGMPICYNWSVSSLRAYLNESLRALRG